MTLVVPRRTVAAVGLAASFIFACSATQQEATDGDDEVDAAAGGAQAGGKPGSGGTAGLRGSGGGGSSGAAGSVSPDAGADAMISPRPWQAPSTPFPLEAIKASKATVFAAVKARTEGVSFQGGGLFLCAGPGIVHISAAGVVQKYWDTNTCGATYAAADGTLLVALGTQGVAQIFKDGRVGVLAALPAGGFTNDLTVDAAGNIYASNSQKGEVLRVTPAGAVTIVASQIPVANGLEVDPTSQYLFVNSSTTGRVLRFTLADATSADALPTPTVFGPSNINNPDGCAFDAWGNLWVAAQGAGEIVILSPAGALLARLQGLGGDSNNLTFGGTARDTVYMTRGDDVLLVAKNVAGFPGHPGASSYKVLRYLDPPATLRPL